MWLNIDTLPQTLGSQTSSQRPHHIGTCFSTWGDNTQDRSALPQNWKNRKKISSPVSLDLTGPHPQSPAVSSKDTDSYRETMQLSNTAPMRYVQDAAWEAWLILCADCFPTLTHPTHPTALLGVPHYSTGVLYLQPKRLNSCFQFPR